MCVFRPLGRGNILWQVLHSCILDFLDDPEFVLGRALCGARRERILLSDSQNEGIPSGVRDNRLLVGEVTPFIVLSISSPQLPNPLPSQKEVGE